MVILVIQNYKIININNEDVLVVYLDYSYEFGKIGRDNKDSIGILDQVKNTLDYIKFNGNKIILMVGTIAIATLLYTGTGFKGNIVSEGNMVSENNSNYLIPSILEKNELFNKNIIEDMKIENRVTSSNISESNDKTPLVITQEDNGQHPINSNQSEINSKTSINTTKQENTPNTSNSQVQNKQVSPSQPVKEAVKENPTTSQPQPSIEQSTQVSQPTEKVQTVPATIVTVYRSNGTVLQIELEEYLIGVVAAEMPASFNIEALKAQAVVARTYTLKKMNSGSVLTDTSSTQEYKDVYQMKAIWQGDFQKYYDKIKSAVDATKGKYITYNGTYIDAVYHSTSNGYTEDSVYVWGNNIPYLKTVDSSWDKAASSYSRTETKDYNTILNILGISITADTPVEVLSRNASGRITLIKIGDSTYTGVNLRNILGLRSADFDIAVQNGNLVFTTRGYGHGVGMSQYGANGMANSGYSYNQILNHYYQGVQIVN